MDQATHSLRQRYPVAIDDGRGFLPDQIGFGAPLGMRADIRLAATAAGTTSAAFIRAALVEKLIMQSRTHPPVVTASAGEVV